MARARELKRACVAYVVGLNSKDADAPVTSQSAAALRKLGALLRAGAPARKTCALPSASIT